MAVISSETQFKDGGGAQGTWRGYLAQTLNVRWLGDIQYADVECQEGIIRVQLLGVHQGPVKPVQQVRSHLQRRMNQPVLVVSWRTHVRWCFVREPQEEEEVRGTSVLTMRWTSHARVGFWRQ